MRKLILIVLVFFCISASAQSRPGDDLTFVYINHTNDTPINDLCKRLGDKVKTAQRVKSPLIIYLANGKKPYIATVGINGSKEEGFDNIIQALQEKNSHPIDTKEDLRNIIEIFNHIDFLSELGVPKYSSMTWQFYIDQQFWKDNYNEEIIAKLYFALDLDLLPNDYLHLMLFYRSDNEFEYDKENPFGVKNLCKNLRNLEFLYY